MSVLGLIVGIIPLAFISGFVVGYTDESIAKEGIKARVINGVLIGFYGIVILDALILALAFFSWSMENL